MKTPNEIVVFIDTLEQKMLRHPSMYSSTPESLEDQLRLLEYLRTFVLSGRPSSAYREYVERVGKSGPLSFTGKLRNDMWHEFCEFFKGYLESQGRSNEQKSSPKTKRRQGK